jgi:hypothetical protein
MNKQIKKQIEAELLAAASEVLKRHHQSKAGKVKKLLKQSNKKILKKISKASKAKDGKAAAARKSKGSRPKKKQQ